MNIIIMVKTSSTNFSTLLSHVFLRSLKQFFYGIFNKTLIDYKIQQNNEIDLKVPSMYIYPFALFLKNDSSHNNAMLIDIAVTDCPSKKNRFFLSYTFLILDNVRLQVQGSLAIFQNILSITNLFRCGLWTEREAFDLFGIHFLYHKDLRKIISDYGFKGYPLRKDFPISGYTEKYYDENERRVLSKNLEFTQEYKKFLFTNTW